MTLVGLAVLGHVGEVLVGGDGDVDLLLGVLHEAAVLAGAGGEVLEGGRVDFELVVQDEGDFEFGEIEGVFVGYEVVCIMLWIKPTDLRLILNHLNRLLGYHLQRTIKSLTQYEPLSYKSFNYSLI